MSEAAKTLVERLEQMTNLGWHAIKEETIALIKSQDAKIRELESKA